MKEAQLREVKGGPWGPAVESAWRDLRNGLRMLSRAPGFTMVAVLVLALGIGVNVAIFSVINAVLFRPLPVKAPNELHFIYAAGPRAGGVGTSKDFSSLRSQQNVFLDLVAVSGDYAKVKVGGDVEQLRGESVSANYFAVLGIAPRFGRALVDEDETAAAEPVVIISDHMWRSRFDADPTMMGKTLRLGLLGLSSDVRAYTIVGVMGPEFKGVSNLWEPTEYWVPLPQRAADYAAALQGADPPRTVDSYGVGVAIGRLRPGVTIEQARAFVATWRQASQPAAKPIDPDFDYSLVVLDARRVRLPFDPMGKLAPSRLALALMAVAGIVLLIGAANLAGMMTARSVARRSEMAVRLTLGAGHWRMAQQLLVEGLMLSALGGAAGLLASRGLVGVFVSAIPTEFGGAWGWTQRASLDVPLDLHVLLFTTAACMGLGILVALAPVREASNTDLLSTLSGASAPAPAHVRSHLRHWVVVPQICFSLLLLLLAGVSVRAILKTALVDPGYHPDRTVFVTFELPLPNRADRSTEERDAYFARRDKLTQRLIEIGEHSLAITSFALTDSLPISPLSTFVIARETFSKGGPHYWVSQSNVTPGYFGTLGISLERGRFFDVRDRLDAPKVAIVDERLAMWLWQGQEPVGQYLALHRPDDTRPPEWLEVVGVVKEVQPPLSDGAPNPFVYLPVEQQTHPYALMAVARGRGYDAELIRELRTAVHEADLDAEIMQSRTLTDAINGLRGPRRMAATILGVSGLVGLFLASIGLYGVVSYSVAQRVKELGIRAALGADRMDITVLVMKEGARVAALGSVFGFMLAFSAIRVTSSQLVAIPAMDVATLVVVPLILAAVILVACYVPARRAARVDPMIVLRGL